MLSKASGIEYSVPLPTYAETSSIKKQETMNTDKQKKAILGSS